MSKGSVDVGVGRSGAGRDPCCPPESCQCGCGTERQRGEGLPGQRGPAGCAWGLQDLEEGASPGPRVGECPGAAVTKCHDWGFKHSVLSQARGWASGQVSAAPLLRSVLPGCLAASPALAALLGVGLPLLSLRLSAHGFSSFHGDMVTGSSTHDDLILNPQLNDTYKDPISK